MPTSNAPLPRRTLGQTLDVSAMGYGAMGISEFYGPSMDNDAQALLDEVADVGIDFIDTADMYGRGHNEQLIGQWIKRRCDISASHSIRIATKCGIDRGNDEYARRINNDPDYIRACCDASLKRLRVERIDLYYLHRVDPEGDIAAAMQCLAELVKAGKIAHVGLCEVSASTLTKAHAVHPVTALQTEYSLWTRDIEAEVLPAAKRLGIGVVPYSPLGRGFLTGRITQQDDLAADDFRRHNPRFQADNLRHNLTLLDSVRHIAECHGATPGQVALAWLLAQDANIVPIPGTRRAAYLHENLGALDLQLTSSDLHDLSSALPPNAASGERYSAEGMKGINA